MRIIADLHTHTIASGHAFSTIRENVSAAKRQGLSCIAITDHYPISIDKTYNYLKNLHLLPDYIDGIRLLKGIEANIIDFDGNIDVPKSILEKLDIVIASFHSCTIPGTIEQHTNAYRNLAVNPRVHIIGHSGSEKYKYDYEEIIPLFRDHGKLIEINENTFLKRPKSVKNCMVIADLCEKHNAPIVVNSDAHSEFSVGIVEKSIAILKEINFPEALIINASEERLENFFYKTGVGS